LLTAAVSRLTGSSPYHVYNQDYWVRETIVSLYRGFRKSFLEGFPRLPDEKFIFLNDFLDRASENLVGHFLDIQCCTLTRKDSEFALGLGEMLLELQFPTVPRNGKIEVPSSNVDESQPGWLEDMAGQTRLLVKALQN
jgi:hypothetical protein